MLPEVKAKEPEEEPVEEPVEDEEEDDDEDEPELIDPQVTLREECAAQEIPAQFKERYEECNEFIRSQKAEAESRGIEYEASCQMEYLEFIKEMDKCVAKTLFSHLK